MKFLDEVEIYVASGHGGPGKVSFRREAMTPRGGPDGGDGGRGGSVIFKVNHNLSSLIDYRSQKKYAAQNGNPGESRNCSGAAGADLIVQVPAGTLIRDSEDNVLIDMTGIDSHVLLEGGRGGKGNAFFKTSVNQAPEHAQPGEEGEQLKIKMELKLIADVGIIGFPNAGKSTLISRISAAKPKIADYPFTTLTPNLGVVKMADFKSFVVADIPGLIKGAHKGSGLGIQFLRHIERTRIFVHLIDIGPTGSGNPIQDFADINYELKMYDESGHEVEGKIELSKRPQIVVFNKLDTIAQEDLDRLMRNFEKDTGLKPMAISGVTGKGIDSLLFALSKIIFKE